MQNVCFNWKVDITSSSIFFPRGQLESLFLTVFKILPHHDIFLVTWLLPLLLECSALKPPKETDMGISQVSLAVPKRYPLKWNKCNYQLLFNKAAEIKPKTETSIFFYFFECTLKILCLNGQTDKNLTSTMYKPYRLYFCSIQFTICDRVWPLQENRQYFVTIYLINGIAGSWKTPELFLFWSTKAMDFVSSSWVKLNSINVCLRNIKHVPCFYGVIETWKFGRTRNAVGTRVLKLDRKLRKREWCFLFPLENSVMKKENNLTMIIKVYTFDCTIMSTASAIQFCVLFLSHCRNTI